MFIDLLLSNFITAGEYCTINNTGESGVCRSIYQCRYAMQQYDQYRIRPTRCGFSGNI